MVYNPPRAGRGKTKNKLAPLHTAEEDQKFLEKRYRELKASYDATPEMDRSRRAYYHRQMTSVDRRLHPEKYDSDGKLIQDGVKKLPKQRTFKGKDQSGKRYTDTPRGSIMGHFGNGEGD